MPSHADRIPYPVGCFFLAGILVFGLALCAEPQAEGRSDKTTLADLPGPARYAISATLGRDRPAYHLKPVENGYRAVHDTQGLMADFRSGSVHVHAGTVRLGLRLEAFGTDDAVRPVGAGPTVVQKNRIEYARGLLTEWYVNGPLGLQQGFTVNRRPAGDSDSLVLELGLTGGLRPRVDEDGLGLSLEDAHGNSRLRYSGLTAYEADGRTLEARLEVEPGRICIRVDATGARYPVVIDPMVEITGITASDGSAGDKYGTSIAISTDTVVVGAPNDDVGSNTDQGSAYVFVKPASGWAIMTEVAKLTASDGDAHDQFGTSVFISSDTVVVGSSSDDIGSNSGQGSAYVFVKPTGGWATMTETAKLTASDGESGDGLGQSVAISGDTIVAGAPYDDLGSNSKQGSAYIFVKPAGGWATMTETAKLIASDGAGGDVLGQSVAICGDTVVAGAPNDDIGSNIVQGSVYVFVKPAGGWTTMTETVKLTASDGAEWDYLGTSVAISNDTVVAGAPEDDIGSNSGQGSAYVFVKPAGGWATMTETAKLTASDGAGDDNLGESVAISGDTIVVGAPGDDIGSNSGQGSAYVFAKPASGWATGTETGKLTTSDGAASDFLGTSVAINGDTIVAGIPRDDIGPNVDQGSISLFTESVPGGRWGRRTETARLVAFDGAQEDRFGTSVSISGDTLVVGVPWDDDNGSDSGSAYVFVKSNAGWPTMAVTAKLTASDGVAGDRFGTSVTISGDTVVVGAREDDVGSNTNQGSAYVFVKPAGGWTNMTETAKLTASDGASEDVFGISVSISGDTVVVGAREDDVGSNTDQGSAHVFVKPAGGWTNMTETAKLTASDGASPDMFGTSVSISGDAIVVGASLDVIGSNTAQGSVYVFVKPAGGWATRTETAKLTASDGAARDYLGQSVSISGNVVVAGAAGLAGPSNTIPGWAYVFVKPSAGWMTTCETAKLTALDGAVDDQFGSSVSISGDTVVVGAPGEDIGSNADQGSAYVFVKPVGGWKHMAETARLTASDGGGTDDLGTSVAISGDALVAGAPADDIGSNVAQGSAYVFVNNSCPPGIGRHLFTHRGPSRMEGFAYAAALAGDVNGDGHCDVVVGVFNDNSKYLNGGSAYVYSGIDGRELTRLYGAAENDMFGHSVSSAGDVDNDGCDDVIVAAVGNSKWGYVCVYGFVGPLWVKHFTLSGSFQPRGVSGIGDVDLDGHDDLVVAYYKFERPDWCAVGDVHSGKDGSKLFEVKIKGCSGRAVGAAGDVNRDGYPDIVLGGTGAYGRIQVFSGKDQSVLHDWTTTHYADGFGSAVSGAGDVNADGYPDVLVGASEYSSATGYARIYSGKDGSELKTLFGKSGNDRFGLSVSGAGDVDGDGHADFIIGAEEAGNRNGYAVIYSGRDYSVICKLTGPAYYNKFGYRVSGGGDVNGDGLPDVVVANPYESPRPGGEVNVYSGVGLPLITDTHQVSVASSGVQTLTIDLGWWDHGRNYGLAGSFGNNPGFMIDDWWVQLNVDLYFGYTVFNPNVFPLSNSWGILDGKGRAQATFTAPNEPALVGLTVYHVCMVFRNQVDLVSPSVPVTFVP